MQVPARTPRARLLTAQPGLASWAAAAPAGMGAGIWFDSEVTFEPQNLASTQLVDTKTPNSEICMANGYSSMVFDQRIFVSFNP
jgi:hypothetical protein